MKLYATLKNERGGKKSTSDDTRILVELSYKNKIVGTVGLYVIRDWPTGEDLGHRVVWQGPEGGMGEVIVEEELKGNMQKDTCETCGKHSSKLTRDLKCPKCDTIVA